MDKIADSIIDMADDWSENHKSRAAVVILGDTKTELFNVLVYGSDNKVKSILMYCMLQDKNFAQYIKDIAEDYDDAVEYYRSFLKETTDS